MGRRCEQAIVYICIYKKQGPVKIRLLIIAVSYHSESQTLINNN